MADLATMAVTQARYHQLKDSEDQAYKMLGEHTLALNRKYNADNHNADMDIPIFRKKDLTESEWRHHQALYLSWNMIAEALLKQECLVIEMKIEFCKSNGNKMVDEMLAEESAKELAAAEDKKRKEAFQKFLIED